MYHLKVIQIFNSRICLQRSTQDAKSCCISQQRILPATSVPAPSASSHTRSARLWPVWRPVARPHLQLVPLLRSKASLNLSALIPDVRRPSPTIKDARHQLKTHQDAPPRALPVQPCRMHGTRPLTRCPMTRLSFRDRRLEMFSSTDASSYVWCLQVR